jgi:hypothetical protein
MPNNPSTLLFAFFLLLLCGCGSKASDENGTDSNTHWLKHCSKDAECGGELRCLCGACSAPCESLSACSGFGEGALCSLAACDTEEVRLCTRACEGQSDCGSGTECAGGECVPRLASSSCSGTGCADAGGAPVPGDGGVGDASAAGEGNGDEGNSGDGNAKGRDSGDDPAGEDDGGSLGEPEPQPDTTTSPEPFHAGECEPLDMAGTLDNCLEVSWVPQGEDCAEWTHCGCIGEDCDRLSQTQADCRRAFSDCLPLEGLCGALDARDCGLCDCEVNPTPFYWNGQDCEAIDCCVGSACDEGWATRDACLADRAGCNNDIPVCDDARFPLVDRDPGHFPAYPPYRFSVRDVDTDGGVPSGYAEWTEAEWVDLLALPLEPDTCPPAGEITHTTCPYPMLLELQTADGLLEIDVTHHWDLAPEIPSPGAVEFRITLDGLMVRARASQMPVLMVGTTDPDNAPAAVARSWTFEPLQVDTGAVACKSPSIECGWLTLAQGLQITSTTDPGLDVELTPLSIRQFSVSSPDGEDVSYLAAHAYASPTLGELPYAPICAAVIPRTDSFVIHWIE